MSRLETNGNRWEGDDGPAGKDLGLCAHIKDRHWEALQMFTKQSEGARTKQEGVKTEAAAAEDGGGPFSLLLPFFSPGGVGRS